MKHLTKENQWREGIRLLDTRGAAIHSSTENVTLNLQWANMIRTTYKHLKFPKVTKKSNCKRKISINNWNNENWRRRTNWRENTLERSEEKTEDEEGGNRRREE